jgi:hypothetical protein
VRRRVRGKDRASRELVVDVEEGARVLDRDLGECVVDDWDDLQDFEDLEAP